MNNVKKYRELRNISQEKLAEMVGLKGRGYIAQCETGVRRLSLNLATRIANVLGVDVYGLLGDDLLAYRPKDIIEFQNMLSALKAALKERMKSC